MLMGRFTTCRSFPRGWVRAGNQSSQRTLGRVAHRRLVWSYHTRRRGSGYEYVKHAYREIILVLLNRVQRKQVPDPLGSVPRRLEIVGHVIDRLQADLIDSPEITTPATNVRVSPNDLRTAFLETTGLALTVYLNRLRITQSLEYLRDEAMTIAEVAGAVGIPDANSYSRLFMNCPGNHGHVKV